MSSPHPFPFWAKVAVEAEKAALQGTKMSCLCFGMVSMAGGMCSLTLRVSGGVGGDGCIRGWVVPRVPGSHPETHRWLPAPRIGHRRPLSASCSGERRMGLICAEHVPGRGMWKGKGGDGVTLSGMKWGTTTVPGVSWCRGRDVLIYIHTHIIYIYVYIYIKKYIFFYMIIYFSI